LNRRSIASGRQSFPFCWQKLMENGKHTSHGRGDCRQARAPAKATGARDCSPASATSLLDASDNR
jgi:hypothetical protein